MKKEDFDQTDLGKHTRKRVDTATIHLGKDGLDAIALLHSLWRTPGRKGLSRSAIIRRALALAVLVEKEGVIPPSTGQTSL